MMKTGLLIISNPTIVYRTLPFIQNEITNTIYIQYFPVPLWNKNLTSKNLDTLQKTPNWPMYSNSVIGLYSKMLSCKHLDVRVLLSGLRNQNVSNLITKNPVEIVYYDQFFSKEEVYKYVCLCVQNKISNCQVIPLPDQIKFSSEEEDTEVTVDHIYDNVVLGGTFDRLHYGHKILLSEAVLRCQKKITVGVTDIQMLRGKKLWELIEPCYYRIQKVRDFLEEVEPTLQYDIVPISDMFGPTKDDPTFQLIVVSSETVGGSSKINEIRSANELNPLCIHQVELLADVNKEDEEEEDKISSSNLRLRCLGTLLRTPQLNPDVPEFPYIVGLTGGIASGKTSITRYLKDLGAGIIDCDEIGHYVYRVGSPGHAKVVEKFGHAILDNSKAIDRKKLGTIVFNDKEKLKTLNELVWPLIIDEALVRVRHLHFQGYRVVILDAAVLIRAQWNRFCHEVWVSIIPPDDAVRRIISRNGLTEDEAKERVEAQLTNMEQVQHANIVFSTLWRAEFTQKQVTKAWTDLQKRLSVPNYHGT